MAGKRGHDERREGGGWGQSSDTNTQQRSRSQRRTHEQCYVTLDVWESAVEPQDETSSSGMAVERFTAAVAGGKDILVSGEGVRALAMLEEASAWACEAC